jgi:hypothetical protein
MPVNKGNNTNSAQVTQCLTQLNHYQLLHLIIIDEYQYPLAAVLNLYLMALNNVNIKYPSSAGEGQGPAPSSAIFCTCASNRMPFNSEHCRFLLSPSIVDESAPDTSRWN